MDSQNIDKTRRNFIKTSTVAAAATAALPESKRISGRQRRNKSWLSRLRWKRNIRRKASARNW